MPRPAPENEIRFRLLSLCWVSVGQPYTIHLPSGGPSAFALCFFFRCRREIIRQSVVGREKMHHPLLSDQAIPILWSCLPGVCVHPCVPLSAVEEQRIVACNPRVFRGKKGMAKVPPDGGRAAGKVCVTVFPTSSGRSPSPLVLPLQKKAIVVKAEEKEINSCTQRSGEKKNMVLRGKEIHFPNANPGPDGQNRTVRSFSFLSRSRA